MEKLVWFQRGDAKVGSDDFDNFGTPSCLSGDGFVLAVGAPYSNGNGAQDSGSVQVYDYADGMSYKQRGATIYGNAAGDLFGWSISISDDGGVLAVGAPGDGTRDTFPGYAKVYVYNGTEYNEVIHLPGEASGFEPDEFGESIAVSGNGRVLAVGAPNPSYPTYGYVNVYNMNATNGVANKVYGLSNGMVASSGCEFGYSVSLSDDGKVLALSAYDCDVMATEEQYATIVYVYAFDGTDYVYVCEKYGEAITISGDGTRFAVRNAFVGVVGVYSVNAAAECPQLGSDLPIAIPPPDIAPMEFLISLSDDGHVLAIADPFSSDGVQVYETNYDSAGQLEYALRDSAINVANATAVSLSDDGSVLAIGTKLRMLDNGEYEDNGSALVYEWKSQSSTPPPTTVSFI